MRKLYALLTGCLITLVSINSANARTVTPDVANFSFTIDAPNNNVFFANTSTLGSEPGTRRAFWSFGDGTVQQTGPLQGTQHHYQVAGTFNVCLRIYRYGTNVHDSVLSAQVCKTIIIETRCSADFITLSVASTQLGKYFVAQPSHNQNKKPVRICWTFGDGSDTCIQYSTSYNGAYAVYHLYAHGGNFNVCVNILYDAGCQAQNCHPLQIINPDSCAANFERIPSPTANPLLAYFRALPQHNNNKKPSKICWTFGDGRDTCINYTDGFTGQYAASHLYDHPGQYQVCVDILYFGGCEARKCETILVGRPDTCHADFERIVSANTNPLQAYFRALPQHNNNRKPSKICWTFGDNRDTCINYTETYTGQYVVSHLYNHAGQYEVCVNIQYFGGCEARKCETILVGRPDTCHADFERIVSANTNPLQAYFRALPQHNNNRKPSKICWTFGDNRDTCINYTETYTGQYVVSHLYNHAGQYEVCVNIQYFGGCEARKCETILVGRPDTCHADFERIPTPTANPLQAYFRALPQHNNNRKPSKICWTFGDNRDTCINYTETYTGQYVVSHLYNHAGQYEVCVNIQYFGGCEARKCETILVGRPDTCHADFERIPTPTANPLQAYFRALPQHNNNRKPSKICWTFGDNRDTCINYTETYTGQYVVSHLYAQRGLYEVCVNIQYFGGCEARKCERVQIGDRDSCHADFERTPAISNDPLLVGLKALPWNNNNRKPARVCWTFGDGRDTCITYSETYTGQYVVSHRYPQPGQYEICVNILYYGGCEARQCRSIIIPPPTNCAVTLFEITPSVTSLTRGFLAIPASTPAGRPVRICWQFGDGHDTCIMVDPLQPTSTFSITHTYPGPGVYHACVNILFQGGCSAYSCREITIRGAVSICGGYMTDSLIGIRALKFKGVSIHASNDDALSYRWTFGDGTSAAGQEVTHIFTLPGNYQVCLLINTRLGCETKICRTIHIEGNTVPALVLSPNPVINILNVGFLSTNTEQVNIRILNSMGTPVRTYTRNVTTGANTWSFDLSNLVAGVYSFVVQSPNQQASAIFIKL